MKDKQGLIAEIQQGLMSGIITEDDIRGFVRTPAIAPVIVQEQHDSDHASEKLSAVEVIFYMAGIVLFFAILSGIGLSWNDGNAFIHILLSAGVGVGLWSIAYYLIKNPIQSDIRRGLIGSLLLTGSLTVIVGGYIISNELIGGFGEVNFITSAVTMGILGGVHIGFDRLVRRDFMLLVGVLLAVAAFPALLFGLLRDADAPMDVWCLIFILTAGLLAYATRVTAKIAVGRPRIHNVFDSFAAFVALMAMYAASYGDLGLLWQIALIGGVLGMFYLSVIAQNKQLLGNASFFLVLTVITISFRYFSGFGVTVSLIIAAMGLLGSAAVASSINKRYFKKD